MTINNTILISCILIIGILFLFNNNVEHMTVTSKPIIWSYWENKTGSSRPPYLDLCLDTFYKHNGMDFDIIVLNEKTVYDYLPELRKDFNNFSIAHKSDYIRIKLLFTYGGIWLDVDTIVMRNLMPIIDKLNEGYDYIGFGCSYNKCDEAMSGYPRPSNQAMAASKNSVLLGRVLYKLNIFVDTHQDESFDYFDMGKKIIWKAIDELQKEQQYRYYQYNSSYDGSRDIDGKWVSVDNHISTTPSTLLGNGHNLFFVFLENSKFMGNNPEYNWFIKLSKKKVLEGPWWISQLLRQSLLAN